jgi:hypothetical protein
MPQNGIEVAKMVYMRVADKNGLQVLDFADSQGACIPTVAKVRPALGRQGY